MRSMLRSSRQRGGALEDVGENRAEDRLQLREIFDHVSDGIFVLDVDESGRFRYAWINATAEKLSGLSEAAGRGRLLEEVTRPEVVALVLPYFRRCVETAQSVHYFFEYHRPGGSADATRYLQTTIVPLTRGRPTAKIARS